MESGTSCREEELVNQSLVSRLFRILSLVVLVF
jgi:hypothetical protein